MSGILNTEENPFFTLFKFPKESESVPADFFESDFYRNAEAAWHKEKVLELAEKAEDGALLCINQVSSDMHINLSVPQFPCLPVAVVTSPNVTVVTPPPTKVDGKTLCK